MLVCVDLAFGNQRFATLMAGRPTKFDFERALYLGCTRPMPTGSPPPAPCLPSLVLVAFRWGDEARAHAAAACERLGIEAHLETHAAAVASAAKHGTDPMGNNFMRESDRDGSLNGTLGEKQAHLSVQERNRKAKAKKGR